MKSAHLKCLSKAKVKQRWWGNSTYRLRYWNRTLAPRPLIYKTVATAPIVYGMRRRVRGSRGVKRRWGSHFSYLSEARVKQRLWGNSTYRLRYWNPSWSLKLTWSSVATAPTVYGIETDKLHLRRWSRARTVATAPTVYGIETYNHSFC